MDVQKTLKLKDVVDEDVFTPLSMVKEDDEEEIEE